MLPAFFHFVCMLFPCNQLFLFFFGNKPGGFHYKCSPIICFLQSQLVLDIAMLSATGQTVIVLIVQCEPFHLLSQILVAKITFAGADLLVREGFLFALKHPGNILGVGVKHHTYLLLPCFRRMVYIIGYIPNHLGLPCQHLGKYLRRVIGITDGTMEGLLFQNPQIILSN